jgi:hypothetical protein
VPEDSPEMNFSANSRAIFSDDSANMLRAAMNTERGTPGPSRCMVVPRGTMRSTWGWFSRYSFSSAWVMGTRRGFMVCRPP